MSSTAPAFHTLLLDSHGLTAAATYDRTFLAVLEQARNDEAAVVVPWTALAEALQGRRKPAVHYAVSRLELVPILEQDYRDAAELMEATGMGGHTIDALVAAVARRQPRPVLIATSDPVDLRRLLQLETGIGVLPV